jgi:hypothetical protein
MNETLTETLRAKHPTFFRDLHGDPTKTCLSCGIECNDGWFDLLSKLCDDITGVDPPENFCFAQIKEKFGGLRIYVDNGNDAIYNLLDELEKLSYTVCESCGTSEEVTSEGSWIKTLCKTCRDLR